MVGEIAKFDFLASSRQNDSFGDIIEDWEGEVQPIAEMETTLDGEAGAIVPVTLETRVTEVGTLELWCVAKTGDRRLKLEFNVR